MRRVLGFLLFLALLGQGAYGYAAPDSTKIYYRAGYRQVDAAYRDNARSLDSLLAKIDRAIADGDLVRVDVRAQSSPEGELNANERLAMNRAIAMKEWIVENAHLSADSVNAISEGIAWHELRRMVAKSDLQGKKEIIEIIDNYPVVDYNADGGVQGTRLQMLAQFRGGEPYRIMYNTMFPNLRNSLTANVVTVDPYGVSVATKDAVRLSYRLDDIVPDMGRRSNREGYARVVKEISNRRAAGEQIEVDLTYYAAPDGAEVEFKDLGEVRVRNLSGSLITDASAPESVFALYDGGEGWSELRRVVASNPSIVDREGILAIIDGNHAGRLELLKQHRDGATWSMLCEDVFPMMRNTVTVTVGTPEAVAALRAADEIINGSPAKIISEEAAVAEQDGAEIQEDSVQEADAAAEVAENDATDKGKEKTAIEYGDPRWAFKTNMLYDAALAPSVEIEYRFTKQWSMALDYEMAWWKNSSKNKIYEVAVISPEVRHWMGVKKPWHGHYIGLFPGFTWYDLENGGTGHRGHGVFAGLSYGYMFPIGRSLSLEAGIGLGYMNLRYKDYEPRDGHHVYQRTKSANYFGPLKARLSLVWRPGSSKAIKKF